MSTKNVIFSNPGDVIDFVKIVEKYPFDMDMKVYDEECDDLWKELDKFVAA